MEVRGRGQFLLCVEIFRTDHFICSRSLIIVYVKHQNLDLVPTKVGWEPKTK